eukprot:gene36297-biopygen952
MLINIPAQIYYSFDTATVSGSTLLNLGSGGAAYNAQLINSPTISTSDKMVGTGAIQFTSSLSQYVQIPYFSTGTSGLSFAFWFKFAETKDISCIFDFGSGSGFGSILFAKSYTGDCDILWTDLKSDSVTPIFGQNVNDNTWRHVVWINYPSGIRIIYLNGKLHKSWEKALYPNQMFLTLNYLGKSNWNGRPYLNGAIDEFYMFPMVLSADQVKQLYSQGATVYTPTTTSTPAPSAALIYYSFDTATVSGSTLLNLGSGGAAYNAQLINSPAISTSDKMVGTGAIQFTSSLSQYVQIPSFTTGTSGLSFAFWFSSSLTGENGRIFDFGNGGPADNILFAFTSGGDSYLMCADGLIINAKYSIFGAYVNDNTWKHVVWTIDPSGIWVVYVNGNIQQSLGKVLHPQAVKRTLNYLGKSNWWWDPYLNGAMDEFYIFESVLSADQVLQLYNQVTEPSSGIILGDEALVYTNPPIHMRDS